MKPTSPENRIPEVDILRGLAVLGMVLWDRGRGMGNFNVASSADYYVNRLIAATDIENTVHLIFAFLFGWGLAQGSRRGASGGSFTAISARRLLALFLIGMANACLFDRTDILHFFAIFGGVFLLFGGLSDGVVVFSAVLCVAIPVLGQRFLAGALSSQAYAGTHLHTSLEGPFILSASYGEMVVTRARESLLELGHPRAYIESADALAPFLFGLYAKRRGVFRDISGNLRFVWRVLAISLAVWGLGLGWGAAARLGFGGIVTASWTLGLLAAEYSEQALALAYVCLVVLLLRTRLWRTLLRPFADVGRLALSNYLLNNFIGSTLFFGYGFGLYNKLGMAAGEAVVVTVFAAMTAISKWWLRRFVFGPAEWLWRTVTYWSPQPFRLSGGAMSDSRHS